MLVELEDVYAFTPALRTRKGDAIDADAHQWPPYCSVSESGARGGFPGEVSGAEGSGFGELAAQRFVGNEAVRAAQMACRRSAGSKVRAAPPAMDGERFDVRARCGNAGGQGFDDWHAEAFECRGIDEGASLLRKSA